MADEQQELTGPDFAVSGVALTDLADGAMLLGHVQREAVLMARRGDALFAIGAQCTHYTGPLVEGLMVGDTVRCPWHHACFSLRTGEAVRAPALNPVPCFTVERRGDRAYVTGKHERDPLVPPDGTGDRAGGEPPASVVIVGAGAAGSAAAETLRREGYTGPVVMIDPDGDAPYDRPNLSKDYLTGDAPEEWIPLRPPGFYEEHGIQLIRSRVDAIDTAARRVRLAGGSWREYGVLLLATGAEAVRLDTPGADLPHVHTLRSLADSRAIIAEAEKGARAVVIGASFIGLEVAASLRKRGLEVHVVAPDVLPLARVMGEELGRMIRALHEEHGVVFHLERTAARIDRDAVVLETGERLPADFVVMGVGVRPRVQLAEEAGLSVDRGVVVDEYMETAVPGVYAAGDIARWPDARLGERVRIEHWVVAQRQGQTAARNILGRRERFGSEPFFWSAHYDISVRYVGHAERWERADVDGSPATRDCSVAFRQGGKTLAVASVRRDRQNLAAEVALERGDERALAELIRPR